MTYADAELVARELLLPHMPARTRVVTELPAEVAGQLPLVQLTRIGGFDETPTLDVVQLDVDAYAATRADAQRLAELVRELLRFRLPGTQTVDGALLCAVDTIGGPQYRPFDATGVRRSGATYQLTIRKV